MVSGKQPTQTKTQPGLRLLADIGGTNARFALARRGCDPEHFHVLKTQEYDGPAEAMAAYIKLKCGAGQPETAVIAVAGPVIGDRVKFTNASWAFSIAGIRRAMGMDRLYVINDFEALAWALPKFSGPDIQKFGRGRQDKTAARVVFGPGTGLGVACFVPQAAAPAHADLAIATEGGHMSLAAGTPREAALIEALGARFGHVSAERVISGPGLRYVYEALAEIDGIEPPASESFGVAAVVRRAREGGDPVASETIAILSAMAGSFAGDLALAFNARAGVYLAGGVISRLGPLFDLRAFRRRFVAKGRYRDWLSAIPSYVVVHPHQAMVGLAHYLDVIEDSTT